MTHNTYHPVKVRDGGRAVWHHADYLAHFGSYDFSVVDSCFKKVMTDLALGHSYQLGEEVIGNWAGLNRTYLAGAMEF